MNPKPAPKLQDKTGLFRPYIPTTAPPTARFSKAVQRRFISA